MGLFKDVYCAECGKKTGLLSRTKLVDGNYLCSECTKRIPVYMQDSFGQYYTLPDYRQFKDYIEYSDEALRPLFHQTHQFYDIHIDTENNLFYIGGFLKNDTVILRFRHIEDFDLIFSVEDFKEGALGDKVTGKILFKIKMNEPLFFYETILMYGAKAKAKKTFFGSEIKYENPNGMDNFLLFFNSAYLADLEAYRDSLLEEYDDYDDTFEEPSDIDVELYQAMSLFMIDDLSVVSLSELKEQRNRLIKTFHPDKAGNNDTKYTQKINSAYELLKEYVKQ